MNDFKTVKYEQDGSVGIITINRPESMNSFNARLRHELFEVCQLSTNDDSLRTIVLTGEGQLFSAGADLKDGGAANKSLYDILLNEFRPIFDCIINAQQPFIAAINGSASGIGLSFALTCDLIIMADNAFMLSPFTTISLIPDGGMNWYLVHQLGYQRAFQLSIESERVSASRCVDLGLANKMVPSDDLLNESVDWAKRLAKRAPLSVSATKKVMRYASHRSWSETFDMEAKIQQELGNSDDFREGVTAFLQKREPVFKGK